MLHIATRPLRMAEVAEGAGKSEDTPSFKRAWSPSFKRAWSSLRDALFIEQGADGWTAAAVPGADDGPPPTRDQHSAVAPKPLNAALASCREKHPGEIRPHRDKGKEVCHMCSPPAYLLAERRAAS